MFRTGKDRLSAPVNDTCTSVFAFAAFDQALQEMWVTLPYLHSTQECTPDFASSQDNLLGINFTSTVCTP